MIKIIIGFDCKRYTGGIQWKEKWRGYGKGKPA
jgi:hypothetical protein